MKVQVLVRLKEGVLDVQGKAVEQGISELGFAGVSNVRIGKLIEFVVPEGSLEDTRAKVSDLCDRLLVNPVIESFEIREA